MNVSLPQDAPIVVIGASAGGVKALFELVVPLPASFPGAVFIVLHISPDRPSEMARLLNNASEMTCQQATDGERTQAGHVYFAPPDFHLTLEEGGMVLTHTARVNHSRPSIDVLFQSAAERHGRQVIGVVLSGMLNDGSAGARVIKAHGGRVIVQSPAEATYAQMPRNAMRATEVDGVLTLAEIGSYLSQLAQTGEGQ